MKLESLFPGFEHCPQRPAWILLHRLLLLLVVAPIYACAMVERDWLEAKQKGTKDAYILFLKGHPNSEFSNDAKYLLGRWQEREEWNKATSIHTVTAYESFLNRQNALTAHPTLNYTTQAKLAIDDLRSKEAEQIASRAEKAALEQTLREKAEEAVALDLISKSVAAIKSFLIHYPIEESFNVETSKLGTKIASEDLVKTFNFLNMAKTECEHRLSKTALPIINSQLNLLAQLLEFAKALESINQCSALAKPSHLAATAHKVKDCFRPPLFWYARHLRERTTRHLVLLPSDLTNGNERVLRELALLDPKLTINPIENALVSPQVELTLVRRTLAVFGLFLAHYDVGSDVHMLKENLPAVLNLEKALVNRIETLEKTAAMLEKAKQLGNAIIQHAPEAMFEKENKLRAIHKLAPIPVHHFCIYHTRLGPENCRADPSLSDILEVKKMLQDGANPRLVRVNGFAPLRYTESRETSSVGSVVIRDISYEVGRIVPAAEGGIELLEYCRQTGLHTIAKLLKEFKTVEPPNDSSESSSDSEVATPPLMVPEKAEPFSSPKIPKKQANPRPNIDELLKGF